MKSLSTTLQFPAVNLDAPRPFPLIRRSHAAEPFARFVAGGAPLAFAAEILSARAELAHAYQARGFSWAGAR
jgi:hypothetical protein